MQDAKICSVASTVLDAVPRAMDGKHAVLSTTRGGNWSLGGDTMDKEVTRGGARPGAGRKPGWRKEVSEARKQHQIRAYDDEWEKIKKYADKVKKETDKKLQSVKNK